MKKIAIIFGGCSNEYTVSLRTCASILENIDKTEFEPIAVGISREGSWYLCNASIDEILLDNWIEKSKPAILSCDPNNSGLFTLENNTYKQIKIDCIFPAVHGQNCEDGTLQGLMKLSGLPYVGCDAISSATTFDKEITHIICSTENIPMARYHCIKRHMYSEQQTITELEQKLGYPMFVKPCCSGSSLGASKAKDKTQLVKAIREAFVHDVKVIVEEEIHGHEVECAVLGNYDELIAPVVGEVKSVDGFYDFDSKYINNTAQIVIPANISEKSSLKIRELSKKIFSLMGCSGLSRVDFFVTANDKVIFNEINTLPGFTSISMYPKMMIHGGITYSELITKLVELSFERKRGEI